MRKWLRTLPPLALVLGVLGAFLRHVELTDGFEPYRGPDIGEGLRGLAAPGCAARWALVALTAVLFAGLAALSVLAARRTQVGDSFRKAFYTKGYLSFAAMALLGLAVIVCAAFCVHAQPPLMELEGMSRWVFLAFLALAGLGMTVMALSAYTQKDSSFLRLGSVMPAALYCYWLVALYRVNAGNPVLADYVYGALAFACAALGFYYAAGYAFGRRNLGGSLLTGPMSVYLLTVTAADPWPTPLRVALIATALYLTVSNRQFFASLEDRKPEEAQTEPREDGGEA